MIGGRKNSDEVKVGEIWKKVGKMKRLDGKSEKGKKWKWRERVKEMESNIIDGYKRRESD